jgi:hypothetical protein
MARVWRFGGLPSSPIVGKGDLKNVIDGDNA